MSVKLANSDASNIPGYRMHTDSSGALVFAKIFAETGEPAASGQIALAREIADALPTEDREILSRQLQCVLQSAKATLRSPGGRLP